MLTYAGVILVWNQWSGSVQRARVLRGVGGAVLLLAAVLYQGRGDERAFIELTTQWWGILGLIGWAYLVGCLVYTVARREPVALVGAMALLHCVYLANWAGLFGGLWLDRWVDIGSILGSNGGLVVAGIVLGRMLLPDSRLATHRSRLVWAGLYGLGLVTAALLLHTLNDVSKAFTFNKIMATPLVGLGHAGGTQHPVHLHPRANPVSPDVVVTGDPGRFRAPRRPRISLRPGPGAHRGLDGPVT